MRGSGGAIDEAGSGEVCCRGACGEGEEGCRGARSSLPIRGGGGAGAGGEAGAGGGASGVGAGSSLLLLGGAGSEAGGVGAGGVGARCCMPLLSRVLSRSSRVWGAIGAGGDAAGGDAAGGDIPGECAAGGVGATAGSEDSSEEVICWRRRSRGSMAVGGGWRSALVVDGTHQDVCEAAIGHVVHCNRVADVEFGPDAGHVVVEGLEEAGGSVIAADLDEGEG